MKSVSAHNVFNNLWPLRTKHMTYVIISTETCAWKSFYKKKRRKWLGNKRSKFINGDIYTGTKSWKRYVLLCKTLYHSCMYLIIHLCITKHSNLGYRVKCVNFILYSLCYVCVWLGSLINFRLMLDNFLLL